MKRRIVNVSALVTAALVALMAGLNFEPHYAGKPLGYWIDQLPSIDIGNDSRSESIQLPGSYSTPAAAAADVERRMSVLRQAHRALDTIGTNHPVMLVARLKLKDSRFMTTVWDWAERLQIIHDSSAYSARLRRGQAMHAFAYLRARAKPVVPQLLDLTANQDTNIQLSAWYALESVAPEELDRRKHPPIIQHAR